MPSKTLNSSSGRLFQLIYALRLDLNKFVVFHQINAIDYDHHWNRSGAEPNSVLLFSETPLHIAASMVGATTHLLLVPR